MKTTSRILFVFLAVLVSANLFAENSVNDLFNTYVIVPAQQRIQILTDELSNVNAQIQDLQDQLAAANTAAAAAAAASLSAGEVIEGPPPVSPLSAQIAELQLRANELQNTLTYWQTQLAAWLSFNTQQQEQYLLVNCGQTVTSSGEDIATILSSPSDRLGPMPNPANPWIVPVFVSTGSAQQDAQLIRDWLYQHGLIDSPSGN